MSDIKNCPFCGSNNIFISTTIHGKVTPGVHFDVPVAVVQCSYCCAAAGFVKINEKVTEAEAIQKAVDLWNTRPEDEDFVYWEETE